MGSKWTWSWDLRQVAPHSTVLAGAQLMTGAEVSATVTVWLQDAVLPQASATCHARVAVKALPQVAFVTVEMIETVPRLTVGSSNCQATPLSTVLFVAQVMVGSGVTVRVARLERLLQLPLATTE